MLKQVSILTISLFTLHGAQAAVNLTAGHADLGLGEGTELEPHIHVETGGAVGGVTETNLDGMEYEADEINILVPSSTFDYVMNTFNGRLAGTEWDPIGVSEGEGYWFLPQVDSGPGGAGALGAPFLGIGAEEVDTGVFDGDALTLTLIGANMPDGAHFSMWQDGPTPNFFMTTTDGFGPGDAFTLGDIALNDHEHVNWGFSHAGIYELTFQSSGFVGGSLETAQETFTFVVPEPSTYGLLTGMAVMMLVLVCRRRA
ncbi:MAG: choice-of-anchor M domain-containing protein [Verrucomicrobiota bacterium]